MTAPRQPNQSDLLSLAQALADFDVQYVVIGGAAMALHGFARMTKDIDLLLPVDPANNSRLLRALESMPQNAEALAQLRPEWMDKGHSTALEGEIYIDLLYVAASRSFEELRQHVQTVVLNDVPVVTLNVDGMLQTKRTTRETDIPDRLKLERLKNALSKSKLPAQVQQGLEVDLAPNPATAETLQPWPGALPEQVKAVARVLANSPSALTLAQIAACFAASTSLKKSLPTLLQTLEALGRAQRMTADGAELWRS